MVETPRVLPELIQLNTREDTREQPDPSFYEAVKSNWYYTYGPMYEKLMQSVRGKKDPNFTVRPEHIRKAPIEIQNDIAYAQSQEEVDFHMDLYEKGIRARRNIQAGGFLPMITAGIISPETLVPVPTVLGVGFAKGLARGAFGGFAISSGTEQIRSKTDPLFTKQEMFINVGAGTIFGGLLGGTVGAATRKWVGKDFHNASNFVEGRKTKDFDVPTEQMKPTPTNPQDKIEGTIEMPVKTKRTTKELFEENGFEYKAKTPEAEAIVEDLNKAVFSPIGKTAEASPVYRGIARYPKSSYSGNLIISMMGDGGQYRNLTKKAGLKSFINDTGGTVEMNKLEHVGTVAQYVQGLQNDFQRFHGIEQPIKPLDIKLGFASKDYQQQAKKFIANVKGEESSAITYEDFADTVARVYINSEKTGGKFVHDNPIIVESANKLKKFFNDMEKKAEDVGFFVRSRNFENTEQFIIQDIDKLYRSVDTLSDKVKPETFATNTRLQLAHETLEQRIADFESINITYKKIYQSQKNYHGKFANMSDEYISRILNSDRTKPKFEVDTDRDTVQSKLSNSLAEKYDLELEELRLIDYLIHEQNLKQADDLLTEYIGGESFFPPDEVLVNYRNAILDMIDEVKAGGKNLNFPKLPKGYKIIIGKNKTVNNRYVAASHNRKDKTITIDEEYIKKTMYKNKSWTKPRIQGVEPLKADQFKNAQEFFDFVKMHEIMHIFNKRRTNESIADYENRINKLALDNIEQQYNLNPKQYKLAVPKDNVYLLKSEQTKIPKSFYKFASPPADINVRTFMKHYAKSNKVFKQGIDFRKSDVNYFARNWDTEAMADYRLSTIDLFANHIKQNPKGKVAAMKEAVDGKRQLVRFKSYMGIFTDYRKKFDTKKVKNINSKSTDDIKELYNETARHIEASVKKPKELVEINKNLTNILKARLSKEEYEEFLENNKLYNAVIGRTSARQEPQRMTNAIPKTEEIDAIANFEAQLIVNKNIMDSALGDIDGTNGKSLNKYAMSRNFDIPNHMLLKENNGFADLIFLHPETVTRLYANKVGPSIEATKMFKGDRFATMQVYEMLDDIVQKYEGDFNLRKNKALETLQIHADQFNTMNRLQLNLNATGSDLGTPINQIGRIAMNSVHVTMMGAVVPASLADTVKVVLTRGFLEVFGRYARSWFTDGAQLAKMKGDAKQLALRAGVGIESILNTGAKMKVEVASEGGMGYRRAFNKTLDTMEKFSDALVDKFYVFTGLNEFTAIGKKMIIPMSVDRIIRTGYALNGVRPKQKFLEKYFDLDLQTMKIIGLDEDDLKKIANYHKQFDPENQYKGKLDVYYDNSFLWADLDPVLATKYMTAIRMEVVNTYVTPTMADKPFLMEGIITGGKFTKKIKKHQSTLYRIPLQLMTWSFGANNKIVNSTLQGRHRGIFSGIVAMTLAGYLGTIIRNPTAFQYMSTEEKIYKSIEYSGLTSYWLDINNMLEIMSQSQYGIRPQVLGVNNPFGEDFADSLAEPFGPAGSVIQSLVELFTDEDMNTRERAHMIKRLIPFNNIFYLRWLFNRAATGISEQLKDDRY